MATTLPGLQSFEIVTSQTSTRLALDGALIGWDHERPMRVNEHLILNRDGAIHQVQGRAPRKPVYRCLLRDPGASEAYARIDRQLGNDPFVTIIDPRLGTLLAVYLGTKVSENLDQMVSGLVVELSFAQTGLRTQMAASASSAATSASQQSTQLLSFTAVGTAFFTLASLAALVDSAVSSYTNLINSVASQYNLATGLAAVGVATTNLILSAGTAVLAFPVVLAARLTYGYCLSAYQLAGATLPPIIQRPMPGRMSLARFVQSLYGGGGAQLELQILALNSIANLYAIPAGTVLLVPDPAAVSL